MRIAYQGVTGAYSEAAARRFKPSADLLGAGRRSSRCFAAVVEQQATHGHTANREHDRAAPSIVTTTCCSSTICPIVGEVKLAVTHHLIVLAGTTIDQVRRIYSHPQGLAQCERYLRSLEGRGDRRHL